MLNRSLLVGRLTKDPSLRYSPNGVAICTFTIASNRPFQSNNGQDADFINCVAFKKQAENVASYMKKGSLVGVDGRLQSRSWDGDDGKKHFATEIACDSVQFLESKGNNQQNNQQSNGQQNQQQNNNQQQNQEDPFAKNGEPIDISDQDLPF